MPPPPIGSLAALVGAVGTPSDPMSAGNEATCSGPPLLRVAVRAPAASCDALMCRTHCNATCAADVGIFVLMRSSRIAGVLLLLPCLVLALRAWRSDRLSFPLPTCLSMLCCPQGVAKRLLGGVFAGSGGSRDLVSFAKSWFMPCLLMGNHPCSLSLGTVAHSPAYRKVARCGPTYRLRDLEFGGVAIAKHHFSLALRVRFGEVALAHLLTHPPMSSDVTHFLLALQGPRRFHFLRLLQAMRASTGGAAPGPPFPRVFRGQASFLGGFIR